MKRIRVAVKIKPVLQSEKENKATVYWKAKSTNTIYQTAYPNKVFYFDDVFNEQEDNETVYLHFCSSLVRLVIQGYNGTIMTFGQVLSGKTHTIMGDEDKKVDGLLFFIIRHIFEFIEVLDGIKVFLIRVSCFEIYKEEIRDLLSSTNESLNLLEENGHVKVSLLSEHVVQQPREIFDFFKEAEMIVISNFRSSGISEAPSNLKGLSPVSVSKQQCFCD
ncbi:centromere-associated protein E [Caerostris extrusa]|uniref:Centromere-associated protein E n=1 Tax=Caerostris extrusa TaxID=172846 RepID=A0AAV4NIY6_CAEEX|nr:centromere-associated protein E [Caerostris extrusa]